jgi:hypothetical protein
MIDLARRLGYKEKDLLNTFLDNEEKLKLLMTD